MDASVIGRDFCPQHLAHLPLGLAPPARQQRPVSKELWLTLLISVVLHSALFLWWSPSPLPAATSSSIAVTLTPPVEVASPSPEVTEKETVESLDEPSSPDTTVKSVPSTSAEGPAAESEVARSLDLSLPDAPLPTPDQPSSPGAVFHPGLRDKLRSARSTRQRLQNTEKNQLTTFRDSAGDTWVDLGNGNCMRSTGREGFTQNWELPRPCGSQLDQGERMLRNMQRAIDESPIIESSIR